MTKDNHQGTNNNKGSMAKKPKHQKEEISLELIELDYLKPKHEPMTPNQREKSEREKSH